MDKIKRMQQLAGLNEITITNPVIFPAFIDEDSPHAQILVDVYYINDFGGAMIEPELNHLPADHGEGFLYIEKGTYGWYDPKEQIFESEEDENTVYVREEYIKYI